LSELIISQGILPFNYEGEKMKEYNRKEFLGLNK